jgi:ankyrin repeat protein
MSESSKPSATPIEGGFSEEDLLAFQDCARYGELEDVAMCLSEKVPVDWQDDKGSTALHKAAANGHAAVIKVLASHGAKFLPNHSNSTPLHWAAMTGEKEAVAALLEAYDDVIDVFAKNDSGKSAMTEALNKGHEEIGRMLLAHKSADKIASGSEGSGAAAGAGGSAAQGGPVEEETDEEVDDDDEGDGEEAEEEDAAAKAAEAMLRSESSGGGSGGAGGAGAGAGAGKR